MMYSRWRPTIGGYDYFKSGEREIPLGNDLPIPSLPRGTKIGVASVEAGRDIPAGAQPAGSGALAVGLIAPTKKAGFLSGLGVLATSTIPSSYLWLATGIVSGWAIFKAKRG